MKTPCIGSGAANTLALPRRLLELVFQTVRHFVPNSSADACADLGMVDRTNDCQAIIQLLPQRLPFFCLVLIDGCKFAVDCASRSRVRSRAFWLTTRIRWRSTTARSMPRSAHIVLVGNVTWWMTALLGALACLSMWGSPIGKPFRIW